MKNFKEVFPDNMDAAAEYLIGKARNEVTENDGTGSPWHELFINDAIMGTISALFWWSDITPDGSDEKAGQSQWITALETFSKDLNWGDRFRGSFARGFTYTSEDEVGRGQDGKYYKYVGGDPFPKSIAAGIDPSGSGDYEEVVWLSAESITNKNGGSVQDEINKNPAPFDSTQDLINSNIESGVRVTTKKVVLSISSTWDISSDEPVSGYYIKMANGNYASLVNDDGDIRHYGAAPYPSDCHDAIQSSINHVNGYKAPKGRWRCEGSLTVYRGFWCEGVGSLQNIGSDIAAVLPIGDDLHSYNDGGNGFPQGDVTIKNILFTNDIAPTYFDFPDPADVITTQNRAFWAVNEQDNVNPLTWINPKTGGANCPHLKIENVTCRNFFIGIDTTTWMSTIDGLQGRYCGIMLRCHGTSTKITRCWPQYPLIAGYQLRLEYSSVDSCSTGEQPVTGYSNSVFGMELHGGNLSVINTGMELKCKSQFLIYNGKYDFKNCWSSIIDGFKPDYVFDIASYPRITIDNCFDFSYYEKAYMRTNRRDNVEGVEFVSAIYPWFLSKPSSQFNVWEKITEDGGEKYIGIFGKSGIDINQPYLLPFSRDNYSTNITDNVDIAKAEYMANFDSTLIGSALYQYRVLIDLSGFEIGDGFSGACDITPLVSSNGVDTAEYPINSESSISYSAVRVADISGEETYQSQVGSFTGDFTSSLIVQGSNQEKQALLIISALSPTMTTAQKQISKCRFINKIRTTCTGVTSREKIIQIARS